MMERYLSRCIVFLPTHHHLPSALSSTKLLAFILPSSQTHVCSYLWPLPRLHSSFISSVSSVLLPTVHPFPFSQNTSRKAGPPAFHHVLLLQCPKWLLWSASCPPRSQCDFLKRELGSSRSGSVISAWCRNVQSPLYTRLFAWHCVLPFQVPTSLSQHIIAECPLFILTVLFTPNMTPCFLLALVALHTIYVFQTFKNLQSRTFLLPSPTSKSKPFSNTAYSPAPLFNPFYQK